MKEEKITIARRLQRIKKYIEKAKYASEFKDDIETYKKELELLERSKSRSKRDRYNFQESNAEISEALKSMSPARLIDFIKNYRSSFETSHDDIARMISVLVEEEPTKYTIISERLLEKSIYPIYIYWFLEGLEKALKARRQFDWGQVLNLCEKAIKIETEPIDASKANYRDFGKYSWVRGEVASLIRVAIEENSKSLENKYFTKLKEILFFIVENDKNPTEEGEKEFGGDNMDYITYSLNCNRGKAMHSLIKYALKVNALQFKESKTVLFEGDVKSLLEKRITEEKSPSVQSVYGIYLNNLFYLDYDWTKSLILKRKLFPEVDGREVFWEAHWYGFIAYGNFSEELYELLKEDYKKAVELLKEPSKDNLRILKYDNRLAEHLMYAYFNGVEDFKERDGIINKFFEIASADLRNHAIYFLGTSMQGRKISSEEKNRLKKFWRWRLKEVKDSELTGFIFWLKNWPENIKEIEDLVLPIIHLIHQDHREGELLEYIKLNISENPEHSINLLRELVHSEKSLQNIFYYLEDLEEIIKTANMKPEMRHKLLEIVDALLKAGYYSLKDLIGN